MHVDEWLDTGIEQHEGEDPRRRDFTKAPNAKRALWKLFSHRPSIRYSVRADGISVEISNRVRSGLKALAAARRTDQTAQDAADRLFALFALSDWHVRLAKCRRCNVYFELNHWNRCYKRRILCPQCNRSNSALECTKHRRERDHDEKIARAAEAISEWEQSSRKGRTRTPWKEYVSKRHPDITPKSLTRWVNAGELKTPAERTKNAES
jgi:hypothetical protein